jgi:hypothetical protein
LKPVQIESAIRLIDGEQSSVLDWGTDTSKTQYTKDGADLQSKFSKRRIKMEVIGFLSHGNRKLPQKVYLLQFKP